VSRYSALFLAALPVMAAIPALAQDTTPPVVTGFTFSPMAVNTTTSPATVTVTEQITDNLSGVATAEADFISPSGNQQANYGLSLISGTDLNGTWQGQVIVPAYSEAGIWTVNNLFLVDHVGNYRNYSTSDLQALGFPTTLTVDPPLTEPDHHLWIPA
jgi:hypothetical protein